MQRELDKKAFKEEDEDILEEEKLKQAFKLHEELARNSLTVEH